MKNEFRKKSKPCGVSGTLWHKIQSGYFDRDRIVARYWRKKGGVKRA